MMRSFTASFKRRSDSLELAADISPLYLSGLRIFFRGYIGNRSDLRSEFHLESDPLEATSDGVLVSHAYRRWGESLSAHVIGEFAAVVEDPERHRVILTHDELGLMPLYYQAADTHLNVATHLEDLAFLNGSPPCLDDMYMFDLLREGWHLGERTPFESINRLAPGQSAVWEDGRLAVRSVWTLNRVPNGDYSDPLEYEEGLRAITSKAVRSAIPEHGLCWCELSGGLDSSTVLAFAARSGKRELAAFSYVFTQTGSADERKWIRTVLEQYPVPSYFVDQDENQPFSEWPTEFRGEPGAHLIKAAGERRYMELLSANSVDTVLTGVGGDATFVGDSPEPYYLADMLQAAKVRELWRGVRRWCEDAPNRRPAFYYLQRCAIEPLLRFYSGKPVRAQSTAVPWLHRAFARRFEGRSDAVSGVPGTPSVAQASVLENVLRCAHWASQANRRAASNFRNPLLSRALVAFMQTVPWVEKIHPACDRLLQRRALKGILPDSILRRGNKPGSDEAIYKGLDLSQDWVELLTRDPEVARRGYVVLQLWREEVERARHGRTAGLRFFLACASLEVWLRQLKQVPRRRTNLEVRQRDSENWDAESPTLPRRG